VGEEGQRLRGRLPVGHLEQLSSVTTRPKSNRLILRRMIRLGAGYPTVTTLRNPSRTSRSVLLSKSFLSWPEGSSFAGALRTLLASRAASRVRSRAVERDQ
jgi:hypothetical protein